MCVCCWGWGVLLPVDPWGGLGRKEQQQTRCILRAPSRYLVCSSVAVEKVLLHEELLQSSAAERIRDALAGAGVTVRRTHQYTRLLLMMIMLLLLLLDLCVMHRVTVYCDAQCDCLLLVALCSAVARLVSLLLHVASNRSGCTLSAGRLHMRRCTPARRLLLLPLAGACQLLHRRGMSTAAWT